MELALLDSDSLKVEFKATVLIILLMFSEEKIAVLWHFTGGNVTPFDGWTQAESLLMSGIVRVEGLEEHFDYSDVLSVRVCEKSSYGFGIMIYFRMTRETNVFAYVSVVCKSCFCCHLLLTLKFGSVSVFLSVSVSPLLSQKTAR